MSPISRPISFVPALPHAPEEMTFNERTSHLQSGERLSRASRFGDRKFRLVGPSKIRYLVVGPFRIYTGRAAVYFAAQLAGTIRRCFVEFYLASPDGTSPSAIAKA